VRCLLLKVYCAISVIPRAPKWNHFGYLTSCGKRHRNGPRSLSDRFSPYIWKKLEGQRVLDYGCGHGADVIACCRHRIDAVGIERRQFWVESAQQKAAEAGVGSRFYNVSKLRCPGRTLRPHPLR
jgi:2-polyprenyl-3-methyl-5-hydroxy-6-metoxy-1,4-benzoquinol methylase